MKPKLRTVVTLTMLWAMSVSAKAQNCPGFAGCLDLSLGTAGFVSVTANNGVASGWATDVAVQNDGKIVVTAESANVENPEVWDSYVLRFDPSGDLDENFGTGGIVRFRFSQASHEWLNAIAIQPDGRILVSGKGDNITTVVRLNLDGSFDTSFGTGGKTNFTLVNRKWAVPYSMLVQADGRIVVGLNSDNTAFGFVRLTSNGAFDTTFNGTGKLVISGGKGSSTAALIDLAIQPDGKYVASGMLPSSSKGSTSQFALMRINTNGALDNSFGSGGKVITNFGGTWSAARNVVVLADGSIVAGGDWLAGGTAGNQSYIFARYLANGQLDTTFGTGGKSVFNSPNFRRMLGLAVQSDGKIVGSGWDRDPSSSNANILIMRVNSNGVLDADFGNTGMTITDYLGRNDQGNAMAVQADGKFVVAGGIDLGNGSPWKIGLVRYLP